MDLTPQKFVVCFFINELIVIHVETYINESASFVTAHLIFSSSAPDLPSMYPPLSLNRLLLFYTSTPDRPSMFYTLVLSKLLLFYTSTLGRYSICYTLTFNKLLLCLNFLLIPFAYSSVSPIHSWYNRNSINHHFRDRNCDG